jgi:DNA-binding FadR family transcriptional regulator
MAADKEAPRASERVHALLREQILGGELEPGAAVPSERALADRLGVNRQAVREGIRRLEQASLVRVTHGGATRVLDWRDEGGLEVLVDLAGEGQGAPPEDLVRSIVEMRATIGVDAARRCAERAGRETLDAVAALAGEAAALIGGDVAALEERYGAMWQTVVQGSGNVAYRLAFNSLQRALPAHPDIAAVMRPTDARRIRAFGAAMAARDGETAVTEASGLLSIA